MLTLTISHLRTTAQIIPAHHVGKTAKAQFVKARYRANTIALLLATHEPQLEVLGVEYALSHAAVDGSITHLFVGVVGLGIIAQYDAVTDMWHTCHSHGNHGKNWASGGTWCTSAKNKTPPEAVINILRHLVQDEVLPPPLSQQGVDLSK